VVVLEAEARLRKAIKIADQMILMGVDAEVAPLLPESSWDGFALLAGVRTPSWRTRDLVVELLAEHDEAAQRMAAISDRLPGVDA
jgi:hypothetical protein